MTKTFYEFKRDGKVASQVEVMWRTFKNYEFYFLFDLNSVFNSFKSY